MTTNAPPVEIRVLEPAAGRDRGLVGALTTMVNEVYAVAEDGLWRPGTPRTSPDELAGLIAVAQLVVATRDGEPVGCVRVHDVDHGTAEFGLLVAAPGHRGTGVGRALLDFVERTTRERGLREMQLELLVPRGWAHPHKEFLSAWYGRRGYRLVRTGSLGDAYPHLVPYLATDCDLQIHRKPLRT